MMLVDSNILINAINASTSKHETAQQILRDYRDDLCIAHQNILESIRVLTHPVFPTPMRGDDALEAIHTIASALTIIVPSQETYVIFLELMGKYMPTSNAIFDTYLVATMLTHGIPQIATDNERNFTHFKEISILNPMSFLK